MNLLSTIVLVTGLTVLTFCNSNNQQRVNKSRKVEISTNINFNFDNYKPKDWEIAITGEGNMCDWKLIDDHGNKILAQLSNEQTDYRFNLITNNHLNYKDVELSVKFKGIDGEGDQGGGPIWRYIDPNNYYVARANPLENNFRVYKVVNGNRIELESASIKINSKQWYNIKIIMKGDRIQCFFNNILELNTTDKTFQDAGRIGLWTKSDAVTYFDDLIVKNKE